MPMQILAVVAEARTARACLDGALAAAAVEPDAAIEALHVKVDPMHLAGAPEEIALQQLRERDEGTAEERARAVKTVFDGWLAGLEAASAARVRWREVVGAEEAIVLQEAKAADLLVLARPHDVDARDAVHAAVFGAKLQLLVPRGWSPTNGKALAGRIAIAWKPTAQAHRAVESAAPWLRRAQRVSMLVIAAARESGGVAEGERLLRDLAVPADLVLIPPSGQEPGDVLLRAAHEVGAGALVMGAYRHGHLIEWALGGTTRHVLAHADLPLFLAH